MREPAAAPGSSVEFRGAPVGVGSRWRVVPGHGWGLPGPVIAGFIRCSAGTKWNAGTVAELLKDEGSIPAADVERCLAQGFDVQAFLALVHALERSAHSPVTHAGVQVGQVVEQGGHLQYAVALPAFDVDFTRGLVEFLADVVNVCHRRTDSPQAGAVAARERLQKIRGPFLSALQKAGVNSTRIARACGELGLPVRWLRGAYLHVGTGACGRMFHSTLTERTPALSAKLARSKSLTAFLLAQQGLPAPRHQLVNSADEAVRAARSLGYPVVVKPDDRDGGEGVHAGLTTDEQVRQCHAQTLAVSRKVLVEKHVHGRDFRITVDDGRVVKAIGRRPGGVVGDGRSTVEELVGRIVAAMPVSRARSSVLSLDAEALELLAERAMSPASVPAEGEAVVLRRRANVSTGGTTYDALGELHPDNAQLAVRVARALRLDIAGIDLIIPDASVSWMETECVICEVNAQPHISTEFAPEVYRDILRRMVPAPGRLRSTLVVHATAGLEPDTGVADACDDFTRQGERVLSVRADGLWLGGQRIGPPGRDTFAAARGAELDTQATAAVAALALDDILAKGLPWLRLDRAVVLHAGPVDPRRLLALLTLLAPHVEGRVELDAQAAASLPADTLAGLKVFTRP